MAKVWTRIRQTIERRGSAALLSVVGAAGSVPRESGARIVLQPDGGFFGSIGGAAALHPLPRRLGPPPCCNGASRRGASQERRASAVLCRGDQSLRAGVRVPPQYLRDG